MVKAPGIAPKAVGMKGPGQRANFMEKVFLNGRMEGYMKAAGKMAINTAVEKCYILTGPYMKAFG